MTFYVILEQRSISDQVTYQRVRMLPPYSEQLEGSVFLLQLLPIMTLYNVEYHANVITDQWA